jgi:adenylate kinase
MRIVLMGMPGVGKGTQAAGLRDRLRLPHISTGDILREAVRSGSALGRRVRGYIDAGELVPDELMGELIAERLRQGDVSRGFILDGFPRTLEQVSILDRVLKGLEIELDRMFLITAPETEIVRRLSGRRVCPRCGAVYHLDSRPPRAAGECDSCGSALVQRPDDAEGVIRERLRVYREQTQPVAEAYRLRSLLREIDGTGEPQAVAERLRAELPS